jgi:hypothetical protein
MKLMAGAIAAILVGALFEAQAFAEDLISLENDLTATLNASNPDAIETGQNWLNGGLVSRIDKVVDWVSWPPVVKGVTATVYDPTGVVRLVVENIYETDQAGGVKTTRVVSRFSETGSLVTREVTPLFYTTTAVLTLPIELNDSLAALPLPASEAQLLTAQLDVLDPEKIETGQKWVDGTMVSRIDKVVDWNASPPVVLAVRATVFDPSGEERTRIENIYESTQSGKIKARRVVTHSLSEGGEASEPDAGVSGPPPTGDPAAPEGQVLAWNVTALELALTKKLNASNPDIIEAGQVWVDGKLMAQIDKVVDSVSSPPVVKQVTAKAFDSSGSLRTVIENVSERDELGGIKTTRVISRYGDDASLVTREAAPLSYALTKTLTAPVELSDSLPALPATPTERQWLTAQLDVLDPERIIMGEKWLDGRLVSRIDKIMDWNSSEPIVKGVTATLFDPCGGALTRIENIYESTQSGQNRARRVVSEFFPKTGGSGDENGCDSGAAGGLDDGSGAGVTSGSGDAGVTSGSGGAGGTSGSGGVDTTSGSGGAGGTSDSNPSATPTVDCSQDDVDKEYQYNVGPFRTDKTEPYMVVRLADIVNVEAEFQRVLNEKPTAKTIYLPSNATVATTNHLIVTVQGWG